jgi:hypothetical protein
VSDIRLMLFDNCRPQVESSSSFENGSLSLHSRCLAISEDERKDSIGKFYVWSVCTICLLSKINFVLFSGFGWCKHGCRMPGTKQDQRSRSIPLWQTFSASFCFWWITCSVHNRMWRWIYHLDCFACNKVIASIVRNVNMFFNTYT